MPHQQHAVNSFEQSTAHCFLYSYDGVGNRLSRVYNGQPTTYVYGPMNQIASQQLYAGALTTFVYDLDGNLLAGNDGAGPATYTWDVKGMLASADSSTGLSSFTHDIDACRRLRQVPSANGTSYTWVGPHVIQENDSVTGALQVEYTFSPWEDSARPAYGAPGHLYSQNSGGSSQFFGYDLAGNTRMLMNNSGAITDTLLFSAFGEELNRTGSTLLYYGFGGQAGYISDNGQLADVRNRVYSPFNAVWLSLDPIGFAGGLWGLYGYVGNNPVIHADPLGQARIELRWRNVTDGFNHAFLLVWDTDKNGNKIGVPRYFGGYKGTGFSQPYLPLQHLVARYGYYVGPQKGQLGAPDWGYFPGGEKGDAYAGGMVVVNDCKPASYYIKKLKAIADGINYINIGYPPIGIFSANSNTVARTYLFYLGIKFPFSSLDNPPEDMPFLPEWNNVFQLSIPGFSGGKDMKVTSPYFPSLDLPEIAPLFRAGPRPNPQIP